MFWTLLIFTLGLSPYQRSNAEIQRLVELLKTVILNDCAVSTVSSYAGAANRWIDWCKCYSFPPLQSNPTALPQVDMLNNFLDSTLLVSKRLAVYYTVNVFCLMDIALYCILICFCH